MTQAERLLRVFEGSSHAHGTTTVGRIGRGGKAEAKSMMNRGPMTVEMVQDHIDGKKGYGAVPITEKNMVRFGALDIDTYNLDLKGLNKKVRDANLPLLLCRSKSGGAHLYLFLDDWYPASLIREYLTEISIALGYSGCEIFPKQDEILAERGDLGSFINMPYHNAETTTRYCLDENGDAMELDDFIDAVDAIRCSPAQIDLSKIVGKRTWFSDGFACLRYILKDGPVAENRNMIMFMVGLYCQKKWPEDWRIQMEQFNGQIFTAPLEAKEVVALQKSLEKKTYGPTCDQEPFKSHCDKAACRNCPFGVGKDDENKATVGGLTVVKTEPPYYFMDVNGKRVELDSEALVNQGKWSRKVMEQIHFLPSTMKQSDWTTLVNGMLKEAVFIEVPRELTLEGRFEDLLKQFCTGSVQAMDPAEVMNGKPWHNNDRIHFRIDALEAFLRGRQFTDYTAGKIQQELKRITGEENCHMAINYRTSDGGRSKTRVWWVNKYEDEPGDMDIETIENETPF
jgi:hypothetical protein